MFIIHFTHTIYIYIFFCKAKLSRGYRHTSRIVKTSSEVSRELLFRLSFNHWDFYTVSFIYLFSNGFNHGRQVYALKYDHVYSIFLRVFYLNCKKYIFINEFSTV